MGVFDKILDRIQTKASEVSFNVSGIRQWQDFSQLIDSDKYLDQYQGWTYKAIKTKADTVVSYTPTLYKINGEEREEVSQDDAFLRDLYRFNEHITYLEARKILQLHLGLAGIAYWHIVVSDDRRYTNEFQILNPTQVTMTVNTVGEPYSYQFTDSDGNIQEIEPDNIVIFREPHPSRLYGGYSPLQASRLSHNSYEYMSRFNMNVFGNMGRPDGFLSFGEIDEKSRKRVEKQLKMKYGGVENARKIGVVNTDVKWTQLTESNKDLDFVNGLVLMRDEILAMHGVPKPLVGLTDSTYTNSIEAQRVFQRYTIKPLLDNEESIYNEQLIRKYFGEEREDLVFVFPNPVEADKKAEAETATIAFQGGYMLVSEAREAVGLEVLPDNDPRNLMLFNDLQLAKFNDFDAVAQGVKEDTEKAIQSVVEIKEKVMTLPQVKETQMNKRDKLRKFYYEKAVKQESILAREIDAFFSEQKARVLNGLSNKEVGLSFDIEKESQLMYDSLIATVFSIAEEYQDIANELVVTPHTLTKAERAEIGKQFKGSALLINETTDGLLETLIADANNEDLGLSDIRSQIDTLFETYGDGAKTTRSETIALTEVSRVKNYTQRVVFQSDDTIESIEWLSAMDNSTRPDHIAADSQVIPKGESFDVGGEKLKYPGDPSGSASNVINCRCTILPVIE